MNRISIVGNSGSGKSTLAKQISQQLGHARLELDAVNHQPNWTPLPRDDFEERVDTFMDTHECWVIDGNYSAVRERIWARADAVIWMSPGRLENMRSILWRTFRRGVLREELWNGNRETLDNFRYLNDPDRSVIAWAWTQHEKYQERYSAAMRDPQWGHLRFVRMRSRASAAAWVASL